MIDYVLVFLILGFLLVIFLKSKGKGGRKGSPIGVYTAQSRLMSVAELKFYRVLLLVIPKDCWVFSQVRLADVIKVRSDLKLNKQQWWRCFSQISQKHVDFVIVRKEDTQIMGVIELNDRSHNEKNRMKRDEFLRKALMYSGVPLAEIKAQKYYDQQQLKAELPFLYPSLQSVI